MISLDSPVASVLGAQTKQGKAKKIVDGLGLRTVGDLLAPLPAPLRPHRRAHHGQGAPRRARCSPWSARSPRASMHTYRDRRTRPHGLPARHDAADRRSLAADVVLRQVQARQPSGTRDRAARSDAGASSSARSARSRGEWQLTNPTMALFGVADDETTGAAVASIKALFPLYPLTKGVDSWDLQRADRLRARPSSTTSPTRCPTPSARSTACSTLAHGAATGSTSPTRGRR